MKSVGICGHFGGNLSFNDGQTVKTRTITEELKSTIGENEINTADTFGWRSKPLQFMVEILQLFINSKNIIVLPSHNGVKVLIPLFLILNIIFKRHLHYIVIGGWLPELVSNNPIIKFLLNKFDHIYIETQTNVETLKQKGLKKVKYLPNYKKIAILNEDDLKQNYSIPFKLCTFSRVTKEKGIEDAILAVKYMNNNSDKIVFTLDVYGPIDSIYRDEFYELMAKAPKYISYKGIINYNESVNVLKDYFCLLFPTHHKTEGLPGTLIDSFSAGVPVIAARWDSVTDFIDESNGYIFEMGCIEELVSILEKISLTPKEIVSKKVNCLKRAQELESDINLDVLFKSIY